MANDFTIENNFLTIFEMYTHQFELSPTNAYMVQQGNSLNIRTHRRKKRYNKKEISSCLKINEKYLNISCLRS